MKLQKTKSRRPYQQRQRMKRQLMMTTSPRKDEACSQRNSQQRGRRGG